MDYEEALDLCDEIVEGCGVIPDEGEDFAESVREKTESMREWIASKRVVTPKMEMALVNMKRGVDNWRHDGRRR